MKKPSESVDAVVEIPAVLVLRLEQSRNAKPAGPLPDDAFDEEEPRSEAQRSACRLMAANVALRKPRYDRVARSKVETSSVTRRWVMSGRMPARSAEVRSLAPRARAPRGRRVAATNARAPDDPDPEPDAAVAAKRAKDAERQRLIELAAFSGLRLGEFLGSSGPPAT
jgi:hypothetical protein